MSFEYYVLDRYNRPVKVSPVDDGIVYLREPYED